MRDHYFRSEKMTIFTVYLCQFCCREDPYQIGAMERLYNMPTTKFKIPTLTLFLPEP